MSMESQELLEETDVEEPSFEHTESQAGEMVKKGLILLALIVGGVAIAIMLWPVNKTQSVLDSPQDDSKADNKGNEGHGDKALIVGVVAIAIMLWHVKKKKSVLNSPQDESTADNKGNEDHGDKVQGKLPPCPADAVVSKPQPESQAPDPPQGSPATLCDGQTGPEREIEVQGKLPPCPADAVVSKPQPEPQTTDPLQGSPATLCDGQTGPEREIDVSRGEHAVTHYQPQVQGKLPPCPADAVVSKPQPESQTPDPPQGSPATFCDGQAGPEREIETTDPLQGSPATLCDGQTGPEREINVSRGERAATHYQPQAPDSVQGSPATLCDVQNGPDREIEKGPGAQPELGRPVQLVRLDKEGDLTLDEEALSCCLEQGGVGDAPVCLVSIIGEQRCGKSFLMNYLLRRLQNPQDTRDESWMGREDELLEGFEWRADEQQVTEGVWAWSQPFWVPAKGGKVAVLLVDTEGSMDIESNKETSIKLSALSMLLSSYQILNIGRRVKDLDLKYLEMFVQVAEVVGEAYGLELIQHLDLLVRDWSSSQVLGVQGGEKYLTKIRQMLEATSPCKHPKALEVLSRSRSRCYLMPFPGKQIMMGSEGTLRDMEEDFRKSLSDYVTTLVSSASQHVQTDRHGELLTGKQLAAKIKNLSAVMKKHHFGFSSPCQMAITFHNQRAMDRAHADHSVFLREQDGLSQRMVDCLKVDPGAMADQFAEQHRSLLERCREEMKEPEETLLKELEAELTQEANTFLETYRERYQSHATNKSVMDRARTDHADFLREKDILSQCMVDCLKVDTGAMADQFAEKHRSLLEWCREEMKEPEETLLTALQAELTREAETFLETYEWCYQRHNINQRAMDCARQDHTDFLKKTNGLSQRMVDCLEVTPSAMAQQLVEQRRSLLGRCWEETKGLEETLLTELEAELTREAETFLETYGVRYQSHVINQSIMDIARRDHPDFLREKGLSPDAIQHIDEILERTLPQLNADLIETCNQRLEENERMMRQTEDMLKKTGEEIKKPEVLNIQKKMKGIEESTVQMEDLEKERSKLENEKEELEKKRNSFKLTRNELEKEMKKLEFFKEIIKKPINDAKGIRSILTRCQQVKDRQPVEILPELDENRSTLHQLGIVPEEILKKFRGRQKALQYIESKLKMQKYRSRKLKLRDVLEITAESVKNWTPQTTGDLPWHFLRKLMALNGTARSTNLEHRAPDDQTVIMNKEELDIHKDLFFLSDTDTSDSLNPLDVLCAVLLCSDSFLQQEILSKMSMCQFALPLLLPALDTPKCTLMLWAMRDIVRKWRPHSLAESRGFREETLVLTKMPTISFVRLGSCSFSKSKLLNEVLSPSQQHHNFFIHCDMESGNVPREIADGLVEISWYFPGGTANSDLFPKPVAVTNLRGDIESHWLQFRFLTEISSAVFIVTESISENQYTLLSSLEESATKYYFIFNNQSGKSKETLGFLNKLAPVLKLNNSHLLQKGRATNQAAYVKSLQSAVAAEMKSSPKRVSIEAMAETARQLGIQVDEDNKECQSASEYAKGITVHIDDVAKYKRENMRLQGEPWKNLAEVEKEMCRMRRQGDIPIEKYKSQLKEELLKLRVQQNKHDLTDSLATFITGIGQLSPIEKHYFLKWMKFDLDHIARQNLSKLRDLYKEKCKNSKDDSKMFVEHDKLISASSLGVEHFMRELGQFYEAECSMVKDGKIAESQRQFTRLPGTAADLMLEGFPMELIDGDVSNIPLQWVTDVLTELHAKLGGRSRMLVITVLGVQSTGKSTLLNTMFGLQFAVSSGRCTRGAFMMLIKVAENFQQELGCDFILVIDTEGLKAPELARLEDSYQHDNELATLVVGLSDITIVNMAMENATEMKDVLQIVVHAFLRMEEIGQKPNCQFVHQNVSDVSAHDQNMRDRKHLLEQLNEMTKAAANMEKKGRERTFSDIMDYDLEKHNWYIPALWHGVPPMAPVNMGYSEKVYELKKYLFEFLKGCLQNRSPKDIPQFLEWVRSLWKAVKHENFIFSFRNSLVAEAYNQLSVKYAEWEWSFRKEMHLWVSEKEIFIQNQPPDKLNTNVLTKLKNEAQEKLRQDAGKILDHLKQYFESGAANLHLIEKYKEDFRRSANGLKNELQNYSFSKLEEAIRIKEGRHKTDAVVSKYKRKIEEKVDRLLNHCRKSKCKLNNDEQEKEFETMWTETLRELSLIPLQKRNIYEDIDSHLRRDLENKGSAAWQMLKGSTSLPNYKTQNFEMKKEYLDLKVIKGYKISLSGVKEYFTQECWHKTETLAQSLIDECNSYTEKTVNGKADYDETYCRELLRMINEQLQQVNVQNLHTTTCFEVDLKLHILGDAARAFQKMHEEFIKEHDPLQRLGKLKPQYLSMFKALYLEKDECQDRAWNFCDQCLRPALVDCVNRRLGIEIVDDILRNEQKANYSIRSSFQFFVLEKLLEENDFNNYVQYTSNYVHFIKTWIQRHLLTHYKENVNLGDFEENILSSVIKNMNDVLKNSKGEKTKTVSAFLDNFCEKLQQNLVIPRDSLEVILFKNTASADQFSAFIEQFIPDLEKQVLSIFENLEIESKLSKLAVKPQDEIFKRVFGCGKQCPFCKVPCDAGAPEHKEHRALVHRPEGLGAYSWNKTGRLVSDICSSSVTSNNTFSCSETKGQFHPYKDYRKYFPDWCIQPDPSITASDYWKFVFKEFNDKFAKAFHALPADLPQDWGKITKEQALESLKKTFKCN